MVAIAGKRAYKAEWERGKRRSETFEERELRLAKRRETYASRATDETWAEAKERSAQWRKIPGNRGRNRASHRWWYEENREWVIRKSTIFNRENKFGLTQDDYDRMLGEQDFKCAICGSEDTGRKSSKQFAIDHDHRTGKVRGLLCSKCNTGIGMLRDDPQVVANALAYLTRGN